MQHVRRLQQELLNEHQTNGVRGGAKEKRPQYQAFLTETGCPPGSDCPLIAECPRHKQPTKGHTREDETTTTKTSNRRARTCQEGRTKRGQQFVNGNWTQQPWKTQRKGPF
eukprot:920169-Amphidinium_carterae.1